MINFLDLRLHHKLIGLLLLTGVIPLLLFWWLTNHQADKWLRQQAISKLETARNVGMAGMQRYFVERQADMANLVQITGEMHRRTLDNMATLRDLKKERVETFFFNHLQDVTRLAANPAFITRIAAIDWLFRQGGRKSDNKQWRDTVEGYAPWINGRQESFGLEDLYFISSLGDVVYSLTHKSELGQNINHPPLNETGLALAFQQANKAPVIQEFKPYQPDDNHSSAFFAAPVLKDEQPIGVLLMRISRQGLTQVMHAGVEPTITGDLYLASADGLRSEPLSAANLMGKKITAPAIQKALQGETGSGTLIGLLSQTALSAWAPLNIPGLNWALILERDATNIFASLHQEKKNWLQKFSEDAGYYDLFLIHPDGNAFYTTARQADFATNLQTGLYANTNLGELIKKVIKTKQFGMSDLAPYPPSDNQPAFFMAQPVIENDQIVMVIALQLPPDAITRIIHHAANSDTIQTFLVGPDKKLRSDAFTNPTNPSTATAFVGGAITTILAPTAVNNALAGRTGTQEYQRSQGKRVLSSFAPILFDSFTWAVIAETELSQIHSVGQPNWQLLAVVLTLILLALISSRIINSNLIYPLLDNTTALKRMASGHFDSLPGRTRKDELGILTHSVNTVAKELLQAGQRIHQAADSLPVSIQQLSTFTATLTNQAITGKGVITTAKAGLEEINRLFIRENNRINDLQHHFESEHNVMTAHIAKMVQLVTQTVEADQKIKNETLTVWRLIHEKILSLHHSASKLSEVGQKNINDGTLRSIKPGKHGKELLIISNLILQYSGEMHAELNEIKQLITNQLETSSQATTSLERLLPSMPSLHHIELQPITLSENMPTATLSALNKLDGLLDSSLTISKKMILATTTLIDMTTGPLKEATSFFTINKPSHDQDALDAAISNRLLADDHPLITHTATINTDTPL